MDCLLVRLSALGDLVHALPVYSALRLAFPDDKIGWLVEDRHSALLSMVPSIDQLHQIPRGKWRKSSFKLGEAIALRREIGEQNYQAAIDLQGLTKSAIWPALAGIPLRVGYGDHDGRELSKLAYNKKITPPPGNRHVIERNLALLQGLDIPPADNLLPLEIPNNAKQTVASWWEADKKVAVLSPGTGWETKCWPPAYFGRLATFLKRELGLMPLVLWGPGEEKLAAEVVAASSGEAKLAPPTSIPEMAQVLQRASLMVGGDSGPTHLAAYMGTPIICPFGASDPKRNGPYGAPGLVLARPMECRPCWKHSCPLEHLECLKRLEPEAFFGRISSWWEETK
jgi:lipopolysaccharide heptosyltransferase I